MEPLIFDRTQADSDFASLNQHILNLKGAYSSNDLNRVGEWTNYLADMIKSNGYAIISPNLKTTWTIYDKPNDNDFNIYLDGIRTIRRSFTIMNTTPNVPYSIKELDTFGGWARANNIEQILYDIESLIISMMSIFIRSDSLMAYSGTEFYFAN